ncbi:MAG: phosphate signaling complex protein PhoU [Myxococcota bacterium]
MPARERMTELRGQILRMGSLAETILARAVESVWERDAEAATRVKDDDLEIDRSDVEIDRSVLRVLALTAPKADDLRAVIAIKTMATDLERVGDLARNIARSALRLSARPQIALPSGLERIAAGSRRLLSSALDCFGSGDTAAARAVIEADDEIDRIQDQIVQAAIARLAEEPTSAPQEVDVILIAEALERVADHATNIAESVILLYDAEIVKHAAKLGSGR